MGKKVSDFLKSEILSSVFYLAFGLCLLLVPDQTVNIICKIVFGLVMIASGIYHIVIYTAEKEKATILDLFTGVIVMVLGIFLFFTPQIVIKILPYLLGALVLVDSIWKIKGSYRLKKAQRGRWKIILIGCLVFIALGVSMLLRNLLLFLGSLIFYAWGEPVYVILMLFSSIFNYYMGTELERLYYDDRKQKINLIFSIIINLAVLVFFKYYGFLLNTIGGIIGIHIPHPELSLPIGLSFYTFRNLSYLFDIYLSKVSAQRNFLTFSVYSTMFPYTSAGPIVRYTDIETQLKQRTINISKFGIGAELFVKGLAKKVLLADNLSVLYSSICGHPQMSVFTSWLGILAYTMQLYFDFSGYSDMAIGLGKMLGFDFNKNFDYPYISTSVSEFWRRWHISLGSWFRDYIYIPLGGNRVSTLKHIRNILVVWALTGLWHGASWNFVLWGVYYGLFLLLEKFVLQKYLKKIPSWLCTVYTMLVVMIGWVFFSQTDFGALGHYLGTMFGIGASGFIDKTALYYLKTGFILLLISILMCRPAPYQYFKRLVRRRPVAAVIINLILFALSIAYMVYNSYTPFLYAKF